MDVKHPALTAKTGIKAGQAWRNRQAARAAGLMSHENFAELLYDEQLTIVAEYEIEWRIEALQAHEREQARERRGRVRKIRGRK